MTTIDPTDDYLHESRKAEAEGYLENKILTASYHGLFRKEFIPEDSDFYCSIDNAYVHESSKHCRKCGR